MLRKCKIETEGANWEGNEVSWLDPALEPMVRDTVYGTCDSLNQR